MKRAQRGVTLSGLMVSAIVIAIAALLVMKVVPEYLENRNINNAIKKVVGGADPGTTVGRIREAYDRQANVDYITAISGADLDITKEGGKIVVSYSYEKRIPLFANVSLLLDFTGTSKE